MSQTQIAVSFNHVSKQYLIGPKYYPSIRDWIATFFSRDFFGGKQSFYALRDLTFQIRRGESVGFIGPNGAGKSTILKLISKVIIPTSGSVTVNGKVTGLLELGAGFHPELTGRENIFFQGTILGMSKNEINARMKNIISFADLGSFIDSPVKHFSSGMHARLGFSVAIHLYPDILLVDEVLAVGDMKFREKCYSRIESFQKNPKNTLIMVSHDLSMLNRLCHRSFLVEHGIIVKEGNTTNIIDEYQKRAG